MKTRFDRLAKLIMESTKPSKKITSKRIIKEDIGDDWDDEGEGLTTDEWFSNNYDKACAAVTDEMALATIKYDEDGLFEQVEECYEEAPEYFQDYLKEYGFTKEEAFKNLVQVITDCGNEQLDDDCWDGMYREKQACYDELEKEIKASPENMEALKLALIELVLKEPEQSGAELDFMIMDTSRWADYNFTFSNELYEKIEAYKDYQGWMYERYWAGDDYCDWDYPEGLVENLGLNDYWGYICDIVCGTYWGTGTYMGALQEAEKIEKEHPEFKKYGDMARAKAKRR